MSSAREPVSRMKSTLPLPVLVVVVLAVVAVIATIWAVLSTNRASSLESELAEVRANANASAYVLEPTENAPNGVQGQVFLNVSGSGVVVVSNLPQPGDNDEFRIWYLQGDGSATEGAALSVSPDGQGFALIPGDAGDYVGIAISLEASGDEAPAAFYLMVADVRSGKG